MLQLLSNHLFYPYSLSIYTVSNILLLYATDEEQFDGYYSPPPLSPEYVPYTPPNRQDLEAYFTLKFKQEK